MADHDDQVLAVLMTQLRDYAGHLVNILAALPIPITVPTGEGHSLMKDTRPALIRAYEIADELPITIESQSHLVSALMHWIVSTEMVVSYAREGGQYRADGVAMMLMSGHRFIDELYGRLGNL